MTTPKTHIDDLPTIIQAELGAFWFFTKICGHKSFDQT